MPLPFININENVAFKVFGTIGNQYVERFANYGIPNNNYWDWQLGVTATVYGVDLTIAYIDTNLDVAGCLATRTATPAPSSPSARRSDPTSLPYHRGPCGPACRTTGRLPSMAHAHSGQAIAFDLAVVGAGLNGSLLALAAGEAGLDTALIDRVPLKSLTEAGFDGRTTAIAYTSQRLFAALGVWHELAAEAEPILDIRISDAGHDGRAEPAVPAFRPSRGRRPRATRRRRWAGSSRTASCAPRCCAGWQPARRSSWWRPTR